MLEMRRESRPTLSLPTPRRPVLPPSQFLSELNDLKKFVVLNYIAVVKALKKRNKQYKASDGCWISCSGRSSHSGVALNE